MVQLQLTFPAHLLVAFTERAAFLFFGEVYYAVGRTSKGSARVNCRVSHKGLTSTLEQSRFFQMLKIGNILNPFFSPFCWMCCPVHPAHVLERERAASSLRDRYPPWGQQPRMGHAAAFLGWQQQPGWGCPKLPLEAGSPEITFGDRCQHTVCCQKSGKPIQADGGYGYY